MQALDQTWSLVKMPSSLFTNIFTDWVTSLHRKITKADFLCPCQKPDRQQMYRQHELGIQTLTLTSQELKKGRKQPWVLCPSTLKWRWGDGGAAEGIYQQKNCDPPGTQLVGQSYRPMAGWDLGSEVPPQLRLQVDAECRPESADRPVARLTFNLLWWAFLPAPSFGISACGCQQLQMGSGKGATVCGIFNKNFITQP